MLAIMTGISIWNYNTNFTQFTSISNIDYYYYYNNGGNNQSGMPVRVEADSSRTGMAAIGGDKKICRLFRKGG